MSKKFYEKIHSLLPEEQQFLDLVFSNNFPFFLQVSEINSSYKDVWGHALMQRHPANLIEDGVINSGYFQNACDIFLRFCKENDIEVQKILRASINVTGYSSKKHGFIHLDHEDFEHYNFIMYLNNVGGSTYFFDGMNEDTANIVAEVKPETNKVIIFKGQPHAQGYCLEGAYRYVLVFTFTTKD
jgi:hypothetical protein